MIIDTHLHTKEFSGDSKLPVEDALLRAKELGMGGICVTDHGSMGILEYADELTAKYGVLVIPGVEVLTDIGDILVFGAKDIPLQDIEAAELVRLVSEQGGITVSAHPFRDNGRGMGDHLWTTPGITAIETLNGRTKPVHNDMARSAAADLGLPCLGGSDSHTIQEVGSIATLFLDEIRSVKDFIRSVRSGRTFPVAPLSENNSKVPVGCNMALSSTFQPLLRKAN
jgi:hypothetical protein